MFCNSTLLHPSVGSDYFSRSAFHQNLVKAESYCQVQAQWEPHTPLGLHDSMRENFYEKPKPQTYEREASPWSGKKSPDHLASISSSLIIQHVSHFARLFTATFHLVRSCCSIPLETPGVRELWRRRDRARSS